MKTWEEILRESANKAIADGATQYRLAQTAGIQRTKLARFIAGASLSLDNACKLGRSLGLELAKRGRK